MILSLPSFRYNLNAFLQALRSVTWVLQKELSHRDGFKEWYPGKQEIMREDQLLRNFVDGRNVVVKERSLEMHSRADIGIFRGRTLKLALNVDVPPNAPSKYIVENMAPLSGLVEPEHYAIGEQYGVRREWCAPELGTAMSSRSATLPGSGLVEFCRKRTNSRDGIRFRRSSMATTWKFAMSYWKWTLILLSPKSGAGRTTPSSTGYEGGLDPQQPLQVFAQD